VIGRRFRRLGLVAAALVVEACQGDAVRPTQTLAVRDTADQVLEGVNFLMSNEGVRRTRVQADTAFLFEASQEAALRHLTVTFYDLNGVQTSTIVADSGQFLMRDGSMNAWGDVVATTPDGKRLTSAELRYDARNRRIWSSQPFVFDHADRHLEGTGFESDPEFRDIRAQQGSGRQKPGQSGGLILPGQ
jgi:LPS export ABC transporter protein LptC